MRAGGAGRRVRRVCGATRASQSRRVAETRDRESHLLRTYGSTFRHLTLERRDTRETECRDPRPDAGGAGAAALSPGLSRVALPETVTSRLERPVDEDRLL